MKFPSVNPANPLHTFGFALFVWFTCTLGMESELTSPESLIILTTFLILAGKLNKAMRLRQINSRGDQSP